MAGWAQRMPGEGNADSDIDGGGDGDGVGYDGDDNNNGGSTLPGDRGVFPPDIHV